MAKKNKKSPEEMSFLDHLEELRWHLVRSTLAVLIVAVVAFFFKDFIFDKILFGPKDINFPTYQFFCNLSTKLGLDDAFCTTEINFILQSREMSGQFSAHLWTSIWAGFIVGFPYLVYELWSFISPGLYENERKNAKGFIFVTSMLFFLGVLFGYYLISPLSINFFGNYQISKEVQNQIDISSYIAIVRSSVIASGLIFELPIIVYFFTKIGLVSSQFLKTYRKHAVVLVLLLAAVITPPDVVSQIVVSIPIFILYEASIFIAKYVEKQDLKAKQKIKKNE